MTKVKTRKSILGLNWVKLKPAEDKSKSSLGLEIPYWFWTSDVLKFNKKKSLSFLLKKEKEIINKYPSTGDGGTGLANSLTSRYQFYNFLRLKSPALEGLQKHGTSSYSMLQKFKGLTYYVLFITITLIFTQNVKECTYGRAVRAYLVFVS